MEARIARLESDVAHIQKDVAEIKVNLKGVEGKIEGLRDKMEAGFTELRQSIAQLSVALEKAYGKSRVEMISTKVWALSTLGGVLLIVAKAFKWI